MGPAEAVSHLYHFCYTLRVDRYVSRSPLFFYENHSSQSKSKQISARVLLPSCVDASVREAQSTKWWATEKDARRDVAFEAYIALYKAGLVDDNLLPSDLGDEKAQDDFVTTEKRPNLAEVDQQMNVWPFIAEQWQSAKELRQTTITVHHAENTKSELNILLPLDLPLIEAFQLYFDSDVPYHVTLGRSTRVFSTSCLDVARKITHLLLKAVFATRVSSHDDFTALLVPALSCHNPQSLRKWVDSCSGTTKTVNKDGMEGLVRDTTHNRAAYILQSIKSATQEEALILSKSLIEEEYSFDGLLQLLEVKKLPKRLDLLHPQATHDKVKQGSGTRYLFADSCEMDDLPYSMAMTAAFVPSILHVIHSALLVINLFLQTLFAY